MDRFEDELPDWLSDAFEQEKKRRLNVDAFVSAAEPLIALVKRRCGDLMSLFNTEFPSELDDLRTALDSLSFRLERPTSRGTLLAEIWVINDGRKLDFFFRDQHGAITSSGPGLYE